MTAWGRAGSKVGETGQRLGSNWPQLCLLFSWKAAQALNPRRCALLHSEAHCSLLSLLLCAKLSTCKPTNTKLCHIANWLRYDYWESKIAHFDFVRQKGFCSTLLFVQYDSPVSKKWNRKNTFPWEKNYCWVEVIFLRMKTLKHVSLFIFRH